MARVARIQLPRAGAGLVQGPGVVVQGPREETSVSEKFNREAVATRAGGTPHSGGDLWLSWGRIFPKGSNRNPAVEGDSFGGMLLDCWETGKRSRDMIWRQGFGRGWFFLVFRAACCLSFGEAKRKPPKFPSLFHLAAQEKTPHNLNITLVNGTKENLRLALAPEFFEPHPAETQKPTPSPGASPKSSRCIKKSVASVRCFPVE